MIHNFKHISSNHTGEIWEHTDTWICYNQNGFKNVLYILDGIYDCNLNDKHIVQRKQEVKLGVGDNYPKKYPCYITGSKYHSFESGMPRYEIKYKKTCKELLQKLIHHFLNRRDVLKDAKLLIEVFKNLENLVNKNLY